MNDLFYDQLEALRAQSLHRKLREIGGAQGPKVQIIRPQLANFSSNDYLGLANDARLRKAAIEFLVSEEGEERHRCLLAANLGSACISAATPGSPELTG
jgi:7-keto-8-aminopelargonate synthetase-like enzyme